MAHDSTAISQLIKIADMTINDPGFPVRTDDELKLDYILSQNNIKLIEQEVHCIPCDVILEYNLEILTDHIRNQLHRNNLFSSMDYYFDLDRKEVLSKKIVYFHRVFIIDKDTVACKICDKVVPKTFAYEHCESSEHRLLLTDHFEHIYDKKKLYFGPGEKSAYKHSFIETHGKTGDAIEYELPELNIQFPNCDDGEIENDEVWQLPPLRHVTKSFLARNRDAIDEFILGFRPNRDSTQ